MGERKGRREREETEIKDEMQGRQKERVRCRE